MSTVNSNISISCSKIYITVVYNFSCRIYSIVEWSWRCKIRIVYNLSSCSVIVRVYVYSVISKIIYCRNITYNFISSWTCTFFHKDSKRVVSYGNIWSCMCSYCLTISICINCCRLIWTNRYCSSCQVYIPTLAEYSCTWITNIQVTTILYFISINSYRIFSNCYISWVCNFISVFRINSYTFLFRCFTYRIS